MMGGTNQILISTGAQSFNNEADYIMKTDTDTDKCLKYQKLSYLDS
jgi:hypothetical protein